MSKNIYFIYISLFLTISFQLISIKIPYKNDIGKAELDFNFESIYKDKLDCKINILEINNPNYSEYDFKLYLINNVVNEITKQYCPYMNKQQAIKYINTLIKFDMIGYIPEFLNLTYMGLKAESINLHHLLKLIPISMLAQITLSLNNHKDILSLNSMLPTITIFIIISIYLINKLMIKSNPYSKSNLIKKYNNIIKNEYDESLKKNVTHFLSNSR